MAKRYENGRWVDVETTQTTGQSANHSQTGSALPYRPTPTAVESSSSNSDTGITEKKYKEKAYSILEGTID